MEWEGEISPEGELFYIESFVQPKLVEKYVTALSEQENTKETARVTDNSSKKSTTKGEAVPLIQNAHLLKISLNQESRKNQDSNVDL